METKAQNNRDTYFDFLRGVAICMVVGIHTVPALSYDGTVINQIGIVIRQILNAAVPLFIAISGYFLAKKQLTTWSERRSFWKKQISKIYIPCLIWSIPLLLWSLRTHSPLTSFLNFFFCGFSIYYFIALIIQYYILLPWLQPFKTKTLAISIIVSFLSIFIVTYVLKVFGLNLPLILYAGPFVVWIMFFVLGGRISENQRRLDSVRVVWIETGGGQIVK